MTAGSSDCYQNNSESDELIRLKRSETADSEPRNGGFNYGDAPDSRRDFDLWPSKGRRPREA